MRIHIGKIRGKRGAYLEFRFREEFASPWEMKDARLGGPVDFSGRVTNTGKGYLVEGLVEAEATFPCDRCLDLFPVKIQNRVQEEFHSRPPVDRDDDDEDEEDDGGEELSDAQEWNLFHGDAFSVETVVRDHLVLALPSKLLCRPDCRGICPRCGQNLNLRECGCSSEDVDPRLAALMDLLNKEQ